MSHTSIPRYVHDLLSACPALHAGPFDIALDNLDAKASRYSVDAEPDALVMKRYLNGDTVRRFGFTLAAQRDAIGSDAMEDTHALYEAVAEWAENMTRTHALPKMDGGRSARRLDVTDGAALMSLSDDANTAAYRMRMALIYVQRGTMPDGDENGHMG